MLTVRDVWRGGHKLEMQVTFNPGVQITIVWRTVNQNDDTLQNSMAVASRK